MTPILRIRKSLSWLRYLAGNYYWLYRGLFYYRWITRESLITPHTDIVIEGLPRCANTFCVSAFKMSQKREVRVAHHHHVFCQIEKGIAWKKPVLVLFRDPCRLFPSMHLRSPQVSIPMASKMYLDFYTRVFAQKENLILADFDEVTSDFGKVIARINNHFKCGFNLFNHTEENVKLIFSQIDALNSRIEGKNVGKLSRPSKKKEIMKKSLNNEINCLNDSGHIESAKKLYRKMIDYISR